MIQVLDHSNVFKYPHKKLFEQIMKQFPISLYVIQNFWQTWGAAQIWHFVSGYPPDKTFLPKYFVGNHFCQEYYQLSLR